MHSLDKESYLRGQKFDKDENTCEATVHFCSIYIEQVSENKQIMRVFCNVDPHLNMPQWLLNQAIKCITLVFLQQLAKMARNLPQVYKDLIAQKKGFYDQVRERMARALLNNGGIDAKPDEEEDQDNVDSDEFQSAEDQEEEVKNNI